MSHMINDLKARLYNAREEYKEAKATARREKAEAHVDGREPDADVMARPGTIAAEIDELPDSIFAAEIKTQQNKKARAEQRAEQVAPLKAAAVERWQKAEEVLKAAQRERDEARKDLDGKDRVLHNARNTVQAADKELARLYERGPVDGDAATA